jgi:tyrosine-protein phosphatase SIW14
MPATRLAVLPSLRQLLTAGGIGTVLLLIAGPVAYAVHQENEMRNFHTVKPGVLYRSGQMTLAGLKRAVHDHGIKTVVTLRDSDPPGEPAPDRGEEKWCRQNDIRHVRISPRPWWAPDGPPPVEEGVRTFREVMADPDNYPVLVHCFAGIHRTGAYCAIYRMEQEHWDNADAIVEMKAYGYYNLPDERDILGYMEQYQPTWKKAPPPAREEPVKKKKDKAKKKPASTPEF